MKKKSLLFLYPVLIGMSLAAGCKNSSIAPGVTEAEHPVVTGVLLADVAPISQSIMHEAVGTVTAGTTSVIASKILAAVDRVLVREGDTVKKGDLLVVLDRRQFQAGVKAAEESLTGAEKLYAAAVAARETASAALALSRTTRDRYAALFDNKAVSSQDYDRILAEYKKAEAEESRTDAEVAAAAAHAEQTRAELESARLSLADTEIVAPQAAVVTHRSVDPGDMAAPNRPLVTIETAANRRLEVQLPETYLARLRQDAELEVVLPALSAAPFAGRVTQILPAADPASRSFLIKIELPSNIPAHSGMFGRARIPIATEERIVVPASALVRHGQLEGIYLADAEHIVHFRLVRTGRTGPEGVEVLSGLDSGDRYVVAPPATLTNGSRIEAGP